MLFNVSMQHKFILKDVKMNGKHCFKDFLEFKIALIEQNTKVQNDVSEFRFILCEIMAIIRYAAALTRIDRHYRLIKCRAIFTQT